LKTIKISSGEERLANLLLRQTPGGLGVWGDYKFVVNQPIDECDYWVVCHGSGLRVVETSLCNSDHVFYVSMEPLENDDSIPNGFLDQFSKLILCDRKVAHKNTIYMNVHTWWVGMEMSYTNGSHSFSRNYSLDYDRLKGMEFPEKKNRISVVVSKKNFLPGHQQRLDFLQKLMTYPIGKYIDVYGGGHLTIPDKWDVIHPYKFHLVLENSVVDDYWTEKLADAFLGFAIPIYHGCQNVFKYFPKDSIVQIDIDDVEATAEKMLSLIQDVDSAGRCERAIDKSRGLVLDDYNIFQIIASMCDAADSHGVKKRKVKLLPKRYFTGSPFKRLIKKYIYYR
jgi:hypothetical protein